MVCSGFCNSYDYIGYKLTVVTWSWAYNDIPYTYIYINNLFKVFVPNRFKNKKVGPLWQFILFNWFMQFFNIPVLLNLVLRFFSVVFDTIRDDARRNNLLYSTRRRFLILLTERGGLFCRQISFYHIAYSQTSVCQTILFNQTD